jgi:hypothetical protein
MSPPDFSSLGRRTAALLAVSGIAPAALSMGPDLRLLALPTGTAVSPLGYSVWLAARTGSSTQPTAAGTRLLTATGAE